jgi:hypothetical protein
MKQNLLCLPPCLTDTENGGSAFFQNVRGLPLVYMAYSSTRSEFKRIPWEEKVWVITDCHYLPGNQESLFQLAVG